MVVLWLKSIFLLVCTEEKPETDAAENGTCSIVNEPAYDPIIPVVENGYRARSVFGGEPDEAVLDIEEVEVCDGALELVVFSEDPLRAGDGKWLIRIVETCREFSLQVGRRLIGAEPLGLDASQRVVNGIAQCADVDRTVGIFRTAQCQRIERASGRRSTAVVDGVVNYRLTAAPRGQSA